MCDYLYNAVKTFLQGQCTIKCLYCGAENPHDNFQAGFIKHSDNCRLEALIEAYQQMNHYYLLVYEEGLFDELDEVI